jgi:hypothetical protein
MPRHSLLANISRELFMTAAQRPAYNDDLRGDESAAAIAALRAIRPPATHTYHGSMSRHALDPSNRTSDVQ